MAKRTRSKPKLPAEQLTAPDADAEPPMVCDPDAGQALSAGLPAAEQEPTADTQPADPVAVAIELPCLPLTEGQSIYLSLQPANGRGASYVDRHVEAQLKDVRQRAALRRLRNALDRVGARLANGQRVASSADCVRWLLEQYAAAIERSEA